MKDNSGTINASELKGLCYDLGYYLNDDEVKLSLQILDKGIPSPFFILLFLSFSFFPLFLIHFFISFLHSFSLFTIIVLFIFIMTDGGGSIDFNEVYYLINNNLINIQLIINNYYNSLWHSGKTIKNSKSLSQPRVIE